MYRTGIVDNNLSNRLKALRAVVPEERGQAVDTAEPHDLKRVVKLQEERGKAAMLATERRIRAEAAMRMTISNGTTQGFPRRWGEFQIAQAYLGIAREVGKVAAAEGQSAAEVQCHLDEAKLRLAQ
ncbi:hypothetical protein ACSSS7_002652 [Eimeria intestinalis]